MAQDNMSSKQIKDIVINTIKKTAEKSIQDADYDKTILATIQYCADATIGQYKIKYHNGYYTAYSKDTSTIYTANAQVYVLVPKNDMSNRMFITGLASNDNSQKVSVRSLEGDQQYYKEGQNYINRITKEIKMSTYDAANKPWQKTIWSKSNNTPRNVEVIDNINEYLKTAKAIRIGATFQTSIEESRKYSGDYGIEFTFKYRKAKTKEVYYKVFRMDTFSMVGTPFSFTTPMPQYLYFDLPETHSTEFVELYNISIFTINFPAYSSLPQDKYDIKIIDLSLHKAVKLYDSDEDKYKLAIMSEDNFNFGTKSTINCSAELRVDGNPVNSLSQQVEYYWAKEDVSVDNVNHPKYNKYTGKGWYCLNKASKNKYDNETVAQLVNYTILQDDMGTPSEYIIWHGDAPEAQDVTLSKTIFSGKQTKLKCVAYYENTKVSSTVTIINPDGYYLLLESENNKIASANNKGNFTLIAGVFKDVVSNSNETIVPEEHSLDTEITYKWVEIDNLKNTKSLPTKEYTEILTSSPGWDSDEDNETLTDEAVATYLVSHDGFDVCIQRYEYYDEKFTYLDNLENLTEDQEIQKTRCLTRKDNIISIKLEKISQQYKDGYKNIRYYILGPSRVQGKYEAGTGVVKDYKSAKIDKVTKYFYNTSEYTQYATKQNTLYLLPANKIHSQATYKVTALRTVNNSTQAIGTATISLVDSEQATTRYELEIVNGDNTFMYDEAGYKPDLLLPELTFKLYDNKSGHELVYDSSLADAGQTFNLTALAPVWTFYKNSYSLLNTTYAPGKPSGCSESIADDHKNELANAASFLFHLAAEYNENKRNSNNITLQITVGDEIVTSSTNFLFVKQGDLGTNGTDLVLSVKNQNYEQYKDSVLSQYNYIGGRMVSPDERHLKNTYMYATNCYNLSGDPIIDYRNARCVNLHFIQGANNEASFTHTNQIELWGQWIQNGQAENINGTSSVWDLEDCAKGNVKYKDYYGKSCYAKPPFTITSASGARYKATISIDTLGTEDNYSLKPSHYPFDNEPSTETVVINNNTYNYAVANNIVKLKAEKETIQGKDGNKIKRTNYAYYKIPYFYFNYTGTDPMPSNIDPARHIVITGGFDEVKYDSAGANPEYNKQNPFCVYLFDENGKDITEEMLNGISNSNTVITWTFSKGFENANTMTPAKISSIKTFPDGFSDTESLYHKYCK